MLIMYEAIYKLGIRYIGIPIPIIVNEFHNPIDRNYATIV